MLLFASSSSSASSSHSDVSANLNSNCWRAGGNNKSIMKIRIENHFKNRVYTSSSSISGHVEILAARDIFFDAVHILLLGTSKTCVDSMHSANVTGHTFLKLEMPIPDSSYPIPRVYEAGQKYTIPFHFIIPTQLTINACKHNTDSQCVQDTHLCVPPSMGSWSGKDDLTPQMATVDYRIVARLFGREHNTKERSSIMEASQSVRVLPAHPEQAPLDISARDRVYKMCNTKALRKSILSGKVGRVTVLAKQPRAVMLSSDSNSASETSVELELTFESRLGQAQPPIITNVNSKIEALTYYCAGVINAFPNIGEWPRAFGADLRGVYTTSTTLSQAPSDELRWRPATKPDEGPTSSPSSKNNHNNKHYEKMASASDHSTGNGRRGSKDSTASSKGAKDNTTVYHAAHLKVPIELPTYKKMFIPTFHSCILSRVYVLLLSVAFSTGGASATVTLRVPLQIGVQAPPSVAADLQGLPTFEAAVEQADADAFLQPWARYQRDVELDQPDCPALPEYAELMARQTVVAAR